jgi:MFS family permease
VSNLLRALRSRNYRLFFAGQVVSLVGMWMQMTAQSWLMYRLTDSAFAVGLLGAAQTGPGLILGPFAGALADRYDRRRLLAATQLLLVFPAFALGGLTLLGRIDPLQIGLLALLTGVIRAAEIPLRQAFLPEIVEREHLFNAISLNSAVFNAARLVGPALAGGVMALWGEGWCFMANAISFLAPITALAAMETAPRVRRPRNGTSMLEEVLEGIRYVRGEPFVLALLGGLMLASIVGMPYSALLPSFAREVLGGDAGTYAVLTSAIGAGAIVSALLLASRSGVKGLERFPALGSATFGAGLLLLSRAKSASVAVPLMALVGAGFMAQMTTTNTLLQLAVPNHLRGRVMSLHSALFLGVVPVGGVIAGKAADVIGEATVLAACGVLLLLGALPLGRALLRCARPLEPQRLAVPPLAPSLEPDVTPPA